MLTCVKYFILESICYLNDWHTFGTTRDENNQQKPPRGSRVVLKSKYTLGTSAVEHVMYAIGWLDKKIKSNTVQLWYYPKSS